MSLNGLGTKFNKLSTTKRYPSNCINNKRRGAKPDILVVKLNVTLTIDSSIWKVEETIGHRFFSFSFFHFVQMHPLFSLFA